MEGIGANNMVPVFSRIRQIELIKHIFGALAVESEFFATFEHRLVVVI
ncbi:Uncharacterised protein [Klebsiella pneumoniae]|nr:Uncharacterised protein [Klebsiella pneumoniae]